MDETRPGLLTMILKQDDCFKPSRNTIRISAISSSFISTICRSFTGVSITISWAPKPGIRRWIFSVEDAEGLSPGSILVFKAGNLLGTTLTRHPGLSGAVSGER
jgi:hypothetical protein